MYWFVYGMRPAWRTIAPCSDTERQNSRRSRNAYGSPRKNAATAARPATASRNAPLFQARAGRQREKDGDGERQEERRRARLRRERKTGQRAGEKGVAPASPAREARRGGESEEDEKRERHVRGREVRGLEVEDREREEEPREEPRLLAVQTAPDGGDEKNGQGAGEGRQEAARRG